MCNDTSPGLSVAGGLLCLKTGILEFQPYFLKFKRKIYILTKIVQGKFCRPY